jgi:hypothetical protein
MPQASYGPRFRPTPEQPHRLSGDNNRQESKPLQRLRQPYRLAMRGTRSQLALIGFVLMPNLRSQLRIAEIGFVLHACPWNGVVEERMTGRVDEPLRPASRFQPEIGFIGVRLFIVTTPRPPPGGNRPAFAGPSSSSPRRGTHECRNARQARMTQARNPKSSVHHVRCPPDLHSLPDAIAVDYSRVFTILQTSPAAVKRKGRNEKGVLSTSVFRQRTLTAS